MTTMTRERFEHLADAYGGDLRRWPQSEREAARALAATDIQAAALLRDADGLDALLDAAPRVVASHALREQVIAAAAGAGLGRRRSGIGVMAWLSGAGWAAAACAGAVFGVVLTGQMTADIRADAVLYQASLTSADDTEVLGG